MSKKLFFYIFITFTSLSKNLYSKQAKYHDSHFFEKCMLGHWSNVRDDYYFCEKQQNTIGRLAFRYYSQTPELQGVLKKAQEGDLEAMREIQVDTLRRIKNFIDRSALVQEAKKDREFKELYDDYMTQASKEDECVQEEEHLRKKEDEYNRRKLLDKWLKIKKNRA